MNIVSTMTSGLKSLGAAYLEGKGAFGDRVRTWEHGSDND